MFSPRAARGFTRTWLRAWRIISSVLVAGDGLPGAAVEVSGLKEGTRSLIVASVAHPARATDKTIRNEKRGEGKLFMGGDFGVPDSSRQQSK
jgi:hypothetical protein